MTVEKIISLIEKKFPKESALSWDNVGLLVGRYNKEVKKVLLTLDVTKEVADEAVSKKCDMIIAHHPLIFSPIKTVTDKDITGEILLKLISDDISVYAAHTNLDCMQGGINTRLAEIFELKNVEIVLPGEYENSGIGRIGDLKEEMTAVEFAKIVKSKLNTPIRLSGNEKRMVKKVALGSGASDDIVQQALEMGADVIVTGDMKYHRNLEFVDMGALVIDAGHYSTEIICMDIFESILKDTDLQIIKSEIKDVFKFI